MGRRARGCRRLHLHSAVTDPNPRGGDCMSAQSDPLPVPGEFTIPDTTYRTADEFAAELTALLDGLARHPDDPIRTGVQDAWLWMLGRRPRMPGLAEDVSPTLENISRLLERAKSVVTTTQATTDDERYAVARCRGCMFAVAWWLSVDVTDVRQALSLDR